MTKKMSLVLVLVAIIFGLVAISLQRHPAAIYKQNATDDNMYYLPGNNWLQVFSSGYNEAVADLVWVKFVIYFSTAPTKAVKQGEFLDDNFRNRQARRNAKESPANYSLNYIDAVTHLDPRFIGAYTHGARLAMYHEGEISRRTIEIAMEILEMGLVQYPNDGQLLFNLGFLCYYEITPLIEDEDEVRNYQEKGARYIQKASTAENAPTYAAELANQLLTRHDLSDLMVEHLKHQFLTETDPDIRQALWEALEKALGEQRKSDLVRYRELFSTWKNRYPYIPIDLFTILAPVTQNAESIGIVQELP